MMKNRCAAALRKGKVIFVADNRVRTNWGCRATSIALKDLIESQYDIIYTVYGNVTGSYSPLTFHEKSKWLKLYGILYSSSKVTKGIGRLFDSADVIRDSVSQSVRLYRKGVLNNSCLKEIDENIRESDAMIVNGEGTFIFSTPNRYDTIMYLLLLKVAQMYGKKTYLLNAMYSDYPSSARNVRLMEEAKEILDSCTMVTARDPLSYDYCKKHLVEDVRYVPDALFTWNKYQKYIDVCKDYPYSTMSYPEMAYKWIDYGKPYLCLSGSSYAARFPEEAKDAYLKLAMALNERVLPTVIVSTCAGDAFLEEVANKSNLPYVAVETNLLAGFSILGNAKAFVSGRWHPSIMASISGTPCVFMDSNSHKTLAIQQMLGYDNPKEYSSLPSSDDIQGIIKDTRCALEQGDKLRGRIKEEAFQLSLDAERGNQIEITPPP